MTARHLRSGAAGEQLARAWLEGRGLQTITANFRCRTGELDLVMLDAECIVIVEVRYRASASHGGPLHSINLRKRQRILRATRRFVQLHPWCRNHPLRFDVLALTGDLQAPDVCWQQRAFDAGTEW